MPEARSLWLCAETAVSHGCRWSLRTPLGLRTWWRTHQVMFAAVTCSVFLQAKDFRLYSQEVLDFGGQVSFLLLLPPSDDVCTAPGQNNPYTPRSGFLTLPLQIFELGEEREPQNPTLLVPLSSETSQELERAVGWAGAPSPSLGEEGWRGMLRAVQVG